MRSRTSERPGFDLAIVGTAGLPPRYGGFETLASHLVAHLAARNRIVVAHSSIDGGEPAANYKGAELSGFNWKANGWQSIPYDVQSLFRLAPRSRTVLVLGVSGCIALPLIRLLWRSVRVVTNIDGAEWRRQKWGPLQRAFLRLSEWLAVRCSHSVIADNEAIRLYLRESMNAPSELIAYGGDGHGEREHEVESEAPLPAGAAGPPYFFSVCRIEPENNIGVILDAFERTPQERLVLVGNWQASEYGRRLRQRYAGIPSIAMLDPIYDAGVLLRLRAGAKAHVHGHSAGGTNPTLVEAMSAGLPTLCFDVAYNRYTTQDLAFYWRSADDLMQLVNSLGPGPLSRCAADMKRIADAEYTWERIAARYREVLQLS